MSNTAINILSSYDINYWTDIIIQSVRVDLINSEVISNFCKKQLFAHYKFLYTSWKEYKPMDKGSLYYKIRIKIDPPDYVKQNPSEQEYY